MNIETQEITNYITSAENNADSASSSSIQELINVSEEILKNYPSSFSDVQSALQGLYFTAGKNALTEYEKSQDQNKLIEAAKAWKRAHELGFRSFDSQTIIIFYQLLNQLEKHENPDSEDFNVEKLILKEHHGKSYSENQLRELILSVTGIIDSKQPTPELKKLLSSWYIQLSEQITGAHFEGEDPTILNEAVSSLVSAIELRKDEISDEIIELYYKAAHISHWQGKQEIASGFVDKAVMMQEQVVSNHPLGKYNIRFLQKRSCTLQAIGHLICEPEYFTKMKKLGWIPEETMGVMLAPSDKVINPAALDLWKKDGLVVTDDSLIKRFSPLQSQLEINTYWMTLPNGQTIHSWCGMLAVQKEWEARGLPPVYKLTEAEIEKGRGILAQVGMPKDAWFVAIHVRDQSNGKDGKQINWKPSSQRDANIDTYLPAIREIVSQGGWVIRLGDKSMKPLPTMEGVIDYPFTSIKSPWMDIFCGAACRFFIATASGPCAIPSAFGVPSVYTNMSPFNGYGLLKEDLYIPKLIWSKKSNSYLSFDEILTRYYYCVNKSVYNQDEVVIQENSPEEISAVIQEMLERNLGTINYTQQDEELQARFKAVAGKYEPYGFNSRIGRDFIKINSSLL